MDIIKKTTLYKKTEYLCADRDYVALNELYRQFMDELSDYGFLPSSWYDFVMSPDNILVTEMYRCKYDFKFVDSNGDKIRKQLLPILNRSDAERACLVDASIYCIVLSLAVLKEAPELYAVYCRPGALFFGIDSFMSNGMSGADKLIMGKYLAYPNIARCYEIISFLRDGYMGASADGRPVSRVSAGSDDSDRPDSNGWFAIHRAAAEGNLKRFKRLASFGAHLYDRVRDGRSVLHIAVQNGNADIVHYLIEEIGFDIDLQERMLSKTALHRAIDNEDRDMVDYLVSHGADYGRYALSPLSYAIERGSLLIVKYFINSGLIDVNSRDSYGEPPLYYAISRGNVPILRFLIHSGASVDGRSMSGMSLVELAVKNGDMKIVRHIVTAMRPSLEQLKHLCDYADDNSTFEVSTYLKGLYRQSALRHADTRLVEVGNVQPVTTPVADPVTEDAGEEMAEESSEMPEMEVAESDRGDISPFAMCELGMLPELLARIERREIDLNSRNDMGYTLLHAACDKGYESVVKSLIEAGADVNVREGAGKGLLRLVLRRGQTPLHRAAAVDSAAIARMLIDAGAAVNCYDYRHSTPLHWAAKHGNYDMVSMLVGAGADVSARDDDGCEPLLMAVKNGSAAVVEYLLDNGADIDSTDNNGDAPIHLATRMGREDIAMLLLRRGADINAQDGAYKTPLHIAVENGMDGLAREYISRGADPYALDLSDKNAGHYALNSENEKIADLFRR